MRASNEAGLPSINVAPNQGKLLWLLALATKARTVLEIGTLGGYSTIWLARALPPGGSLVSLDSTPATRRSPRGISTEPASRGRWRSSSARPSSPCAHSSRRNGPGYDFIFIDADKESTTEYFDLSLQLSHAGSLIVVDNVVRGGRIAHEANGDTSVQGMQRFLDALASERRVSATATRPWAQGPLRLRPRPRHQRGRLRASRPLDRGAHGALDIA